ncbi:MAG: hypothetical protein ACYSSI_08175 [Planctomycetota bacterium]|jgi:hypothetical protein
MFKLLNEKILHHIHMPTRGNAALKIDHLVHDERFWALLVGIALIAGFVILVILISLYAESNPDSMPELPTYFYHF